MTILPLTEFPLFRDLPEEMLDKVVGLCTETTHPQGEVVFREGEKADKLHFLLEGAILLKVKLTSRPENITVSAVNKKYESFGWSGIIPPYHYTASAVCEEDCNILTIHGDDFMKILNDYPEAGFVVMQRIAEIIASRLGNSRQAFLRTL